tara:strand:- start:33 stop:275 length:243 start_codon:yes stop_codon:yes gene_type:complete
MEKPTSPQKGPCKVKVEEGNMYFWCSCGLSLKQPFCDGSHSKEGKFKPHRYIAKTNKEIIFCGCKLTKHPPFCDNSHLKF